MHTLRSTILSATATSTTMNDIPQPLTISPAHTAPATSTHASAWSVTSESTVPVPGAPTYSQRTRLHCPHCSCAFTHRMGLLGHTRLHDNLRIWFLRPFNYPYELNMMKRIIITDTPDSFSSRSSVLG
ncbi:unnamed protein product [Schistocephalus solidus]|uniref:C2H2-type domain-containing protein n=1 Tax=Schistocephalus solidus TaxID=70667 RepID=A0A183SXG3_SCHSO|nr:unnamed protein product [Schistocephalus solidus]